MAAGCGLALAVVSIELHGLMQKVGRSHDEVAHGTQIIRPILNGTQGC